MRHEVRVLEWGVRCMCVCVCVCVCVLMGRQGQLECGMRCVYWSAA